MEKQEQLNVVIVDDNPMVLNTLDEMINAEDGLTVIGKADNGEDAIDMIKGHNTGYCASGYGYAKGRRDYNC